MTEKSTERSDNDNKNHKQNVNVPEVRFPEFNNEWIKIPAKEVFKSYSNKKHDGTLPVLAVTQDQGVVPRNSLDLKINTTQKSVKSYKIIEAGDFVISLRSFQGGIEYSSIKGICSPAYTILKPKLEIDDMFYKHYLKKDSFISRLSYAVRGIRDGKQISYADFSEIIIPYTSTNEQEKIGKFLDCIDKKIRLMEKKKIHFQRIKKYFLSNMFCDKQNVPQLRFPGFNGEWKLVKMTEIANVKGGKRIPKGYSLTDINNNHPYITISDMENGTVSLSNIKYVPDDVVEQISNYTIYEEDLFVSVAGTLGLVGKIPPELNGANLTENADKITDIKVNQNFLVYILNTSILNKLIHKTKTDNAQPKLAIKELRDMKFYIPTTKEQEKIANFISIIDSKVKLMENEILKNQQFKNSLLSKMFC